MGGHHVLRHGCTLLLQLHLLHPADHREWPRGDVQLWSGPEGQAESTVNVKAALTWER